MKNRHHLDPNAGLDNILIHNNFTTSHILAEASHEFTQDMKTTSETWHKITGIF